MGKKKAKETTYYCIIGGSNDEDDEAIKVKATSRRAAADKVREDLPSNKSVKKALTWKEAWDQGWKGMAN